MIPVFFVYGLSFFVLGFAIFMQSRKGSDFKFGRYLYLLGLFGVLHSVNEWIDMFLLLGSDYWTPKVFTGLGIARFVIGKTSYIFLLLFGLTLMKSLSPKTRSLYIASLGICAFLLIGLFAYGFIRHFDSVWFLRTDYAARYFAAFPGAVMAGIAIWLYKDTIEIKVFNKELVPFWFKCCAFLFWCYAILAGLIVKKSDFFPANIINSTAFMEFTGLPVQVFRAGCAIGLAIFMVRILRLFEYERTLKLENAYKEIIRISTHEQERIGRDIHDGLCQELAGIQLLVKAAENGMGDAFQLEKSLMKKIGDTAATATSTARAMAKNLYPIEIEERSLVHALNDYCDRVAERHSIHCRFSALGESTKIDHMVSNHLFRMVQEAVSNAINHGNATKIDVSLGVAKSIKVTISDNGKGIQEPLEKTTGMGIKIMKYRASVLNGRFAIKPLPLGGTEVEIEL